MQMDADIMVIATRIPNFKITDCGDTPRPIEMGADALGQRESRGMRGDALQAYRGGPGPD